MSRSVTAFTLFLAFCLTIQAQVSRYEDLVAYICNPSLVEENQLPPHVPLIPFENEEQALAGDWNRSGYYQSLNGTWRFMWTRSPLESPVDFHLGGFDASQWSDIQVPGTWQMQGFGYNIYRNVPMEFEPYDPPNVPIDFNPSGYYIREFNLPDSWEGRRTILHFDGVKAACWVWINGQYLGFDKGSMTPAEFDISEFLVPGKNKIAVQVVRWSDGSYLEDQDMWRFAGIYRRVYLYSLPAVRVRDIFVRTSLDDNYSDAILEIDCHLKNASPEDPGRLNVSARLYDHSGRSIAGFSAGLKSLPPGRENTLLLSKKIEKPALWSAEKPNLYTLVLLLENQEGKKLQIIEEKVGFRELEIRNAQLLVNGVPVMIRGVNRHEHDPLTGRTMTRERLEQDFRLMKELNVNSIRTCHYPDDPLFYDLADQWGLYICNEVNAECHYGERYLAGQSGWETAFMDRTRRYLQRDKNHPCVILWSMGNECGLAPVHYKMAAYVKKSDPTRFVYHQTNYPNGDAPFADVCGTRYPNPAMLDAIADTTRRPVILGEYAHAVANSMGHFDDYWERFNKYPSLQGGYIWDWVNQGLKLDLVTTPDQSPCQQQAVLMGRPEHLKGISGKAIALSGLDDFVEITPHPVLNITGSELTLQTWVFPRGFNGSNALIAKGDHSFALEQNHRDSIHFTVHTDRMYRLAGYLPRDWNYNWHHVAGIYNGKSLEIYLDGEKISGMPASGNIKRTFYPITIGKNHERDHESTPGPVSNAIFDRVRIHNTALNPEDLDWARDKPDVTSGLLLALDFEDFSREGQFLCYGATPWASATMDGIIFSERGYQPESWQVKKSHAPMKVAALNLDKGIFEIRNLHHFTNLEEFSLKWKLTEDGKIIQEGELNPSVPAQSSGRIAVPFKVTLPRPGAEYHLRLELCNREDLYWAPKDYEICFEEFRLPLKAPKENSMVPGELSIEESGNRINIEGEGFEYVFDKSLGRLEQIRYHGAEFLLEGPRLNVSRPPIVNEISEWTRAEYKEWYEWGLDSLLHEVHSVYTEKISENEFLVRTEVHSFSFRERALQFISEFEHRFLGSGDLIIDHRVICNLEFPARRANQDIHWIQKIGLEMELAEGARDLSWFGKGPFETYPDRKTGAKTGVYSIPIEEIRMPYILPQEFGNHTDVRWAVIGYEKGGGLAFFADDLMNISINPYTNLESTWYPYQLRRSDRVTLNIDHRVSGVGGTPITVRHAYRTYPDEYHYRIRIKPFDPLKIDPVELGREAW